VIRKKIKFLFVLRLTTILQLYLLSVITIMALGYPTEDSLPRIKKSLAKILYYEKWGKREPFSSDPSEDRTYGFSSSKRTKRLWSGNPQVQKLAENVYAITDLYHSRGKLAGVNAGIIFTERSVIFIDSGMTVDSGEYLWKVAQEKMVGNEALYLILTHHHSDHVFGMRPLKEKGAHIIAHRLVAAELKDDHGRYKRFIVNSMGWSPEKGDEIFGDVALSIPDRIIEEDTILNIDGEEIHLLLTPGHTPDSIAIYHPKSGTLFAGDAVYEGMRPNARFGGPEEWKLWISRLERLKQLEIKTIVPGHGKLCSKDEIDRNIAYLKELIPKQR